MKCTLHQVGLCGCHPCKTPLHWRHLKKHLQFATEHVDKDLYFWESVLWADETKIELLGHNDRLYVWRESGQAFNPKNTLPTVKHGWSNIKLWGCFSANGTVVPAYNNTLRIVRNRCYIRSVVTSEALKMATLNCQFLGSADCCKRNLSHSPSGQSLVEVNHSSDWPSSSAASFESVKQSLNNFLSERSEIFPVSDPKMSLQPE